MRFMEYAYQKTLIGSNIGVVFGAFAPLHQGHLDVIMRAKKENDGCIVIVCGYENDRGGELMPFSKRYQYVREFFADDELISVYAIDEDELGISQMTNQWETWLSEFEKIWELSVGENVNRIWYVGESDYQYHLNAIGESTILIDRGLNPISATMIRNNPIKYWNAISHTFRKVFSHNILISGTASEGKTTLTMDLGKYFNAPYSHEWAIDYINQKCLSETELEEIDYLAFLNGQFSLNESLINSHANKGIFFSDTDAIITKMYAEYYSQDDSMHLSIEQSDKISIFADEYIKKAKWDKVFLLAPKGVFVDNGIRCMKHSGMDSRNELFNILCRELKSAGLWDKVTILQDGYYGNFKTICEYVKGIMGNEQS